MKKLDVLVTFSAGRRNEAYIWQTSAEQVIMNIWNIRLNTPLSAAMFGYSSQRTHKGLAQILCKLKIY